MYTVIFYRFNDEFSYTLGTYRSEKLARKLATALATRTDVRQIMVVAANGRTM